jgi:hypothetical protein
MAASAAHLIDHVFPTLPVRQWVLSVPKRLRWYRGREPRAISAVLLIVLRVIEVHLRLFSGARPAFALERLNLLDDECVVYRLRKPRRDGSTALTLTLLELIDDLAALMPRPRRHRHRYHGVLAPTSRLRAPLATTVSPRRWVLTAHPAPARLLSWANLDA